MNKKGSDNNHGIKTANKWNISWTKNIINYLKILNGEQVLLEGYKTTKQAIGLGTAKLHHIFFALFLTLKHDILPFKWFSKKVMQ